MLDILKYGGFAVNSVDTKKISWKQGLAIALGVPVLILPSIGYFASYVWAFAIIIWLLSILQGFIQNTAYGELALMYPTVSGLPGFAQKVFKGKSSNDYDAGKFIGGFSAWGYWFAWNPVLAIFSLLIGKYLHALIPVASHVPESVVSIAAGLFIFILLIIINWKGLSGGAAAGNVLALLSLTPLLVISIVPVLKGQFHLSNITKSIFPDDWSFDIRHFFIFLGIMAMAQWSACAWETAAVYAPDYKDPGRDLPKALFSCGGICIITFFIVQTACTGTLGIKGILEDTDSPMLSMAKLSFGDIGAMIAVIMLIAAMVLIIQTALLGSSKAMQSMAKEGNLPKIFAKTNKHDTPYIAMLSIAALNMILIYSGTPSAVLAASALGYVVANGISLFAYVKAKTEHKGGKKINGFSAPDWWKYAALVCGILNLPFYFTGLLIINSLDFGVTHSLIGIVVLLIYIPLWLYSKKENMI